MDLQEVTWDKDGQVRARGPPPQKRRQKSSVGNRIFCTPQNSSAVMSVELVSDRKSHTVLRGCWFNIIVLNVHAPSEEKSYDSKDSFL